VGSCAAARGDSAGGGEPPVPLGHPMPAKPPRCGRRNGLTRFSLEEDDDGAVEISSEAAEEETDDNARAKAFGSPDPAAARHVGGQLRAARARCSAAFKSNLVAPEDKMCLALEENLELHERVSLLEKALQQGERELKGARTESASLRAELASLNGASRQQRFMPEEPEPAPEGTIPCTSTPSMREQLMQAKDVEAELHRRLQELEKRIVATEIPVAERAKPGFSIWDGLAAVFCNGRGGVPKSGAGARDGCGMEVCCVRPPSAAAAGALQVADAAAQVEHAAQA